MSARKSLPRAKKVRLTETYFELIRKLPLLSIADEVALTAAEAMIERLLQQRLDAGGQAYLDALSDLVEQYEDAHYDIEVTPGPRLLASLMEDNGLSQAELSRKTGIAKSTLSAVLAGQRGLTVDQMHTLGQHFAVEPAIFLNH